MGNRKIRPLRETGEHSYHRRAFGHNYFNPFIYHIILKKTDSCEPFGSVEGDATIAPGNPGCVFIRESDLGKIIAKGILHFPYLYPIVKILQFCVMPDHVHILLQILYKSDKHLDFYMERLRERILSVYSRKVGRVVTDREIFERGYCDKPLYDNRSLDGLYNYIRMNPHRLGMRKQFPRFFQRVRRLKIKDCECEGYGNLFLLRNPDKEAVKISRSFTPEEKIAKSSAWLSAASTGTILVSPFISKEEKGIRREAESSGANIILIIHTAFPDRYKPAAHDFSLCAEGRLLIISLGFPEQTPLTRDLCMRMNALARTIATL